MKSLFLALGFFSLAGALHAFGTAGSTSTTRTINVPGFAYDFTIDFAWMCDDFPRNSEPGRAQLFDAGGNIVAEISGGVYRSGGPSVSLIGSGTYDVGPWYANIYASSGAPADARLRVVWHVTGLSPGNYTLKLWNYTTSDTLVHASTVTTNTFYVIGQSVGPVNQSPTIAWTWAPSTASNGQSYFVAARAHDSNGNLALVNVWKNGVPFAFAGGGNGTDGDSGNPTSDSGPRTVTFTAQAVDTAGATSAVISLTVAIAGPVNNPPTVTLLSPGSQTVTAGTALTISSRATDPDGNLSNHNLDIQRPDGAWNFEAGFSTGEPFQGGPVASDGDSTRSATFTFTDVGTYHVRAAAADPGGWYHSATVDIVVVPPNQAPTIVWTSAPGAVVSGQAYVISAHGHDADGNLSQVRIWKNGTTLVTATPGGTDGDASGSNTDTGPVTVTFTAQALDAAGAVSATISQTVTINAPPPPQYTLATIASAGGTVSAGGVFTAGTLASVTASPDIAHDFTGWSRDAAGTSNPLSVLMDRDKTVVANFSAKSFALVTTTNGGGGVSPGGTYGYGTTVTVTATPDATHRFTGWSGDASGTAASVTLTVTRALAVQAVFAAKTAQALSFPVIADQTVGASFPLNITASSGLPVAVVVSGPANYAGGVLTLTGPGIVSIQAAQAGDDFYLPAAPVSRSFNSAGPTVLRYRATARTLLQTQRTTETIPYVIQPNP